MRYFKCEDLKSVDREIIFQDVSLTEEEKKRNRQGKLWNFAAITLDSIVFLAVFCGSEFMVAQIPAPENTFLFVLAIVGRILLTLVEFIVSIVVGTLVSSPILKKAQSKLVIQKRIYFDKAILSLRKYYAWTEPCIVTKCYDSSEKAFKNRDICIFVVDDELRLTADLKHGFSIREKDLGCYTIRGDEISLEYIQGEQFLITELRSGNVTFRLGRRAKGFIENNFICKEKEK